MKRLVVTTSLALSLSFGAAYAQQTTDPQATAPATQGEYHHHTPNPHRQAEHLSRKLNLTPDQTAKIEPILAARDQQMHDLMGNAQLSPQDRHQGMHSINQQAEQGMSGILSPDQMAQLKAMHHRGHHGQGGDEQPTPAPTA